MTLSDELRTEVAKIFSTRWTKRESEEVPEPADVKLGNDAVLLGQATVLYADLSESTGLVRGWKDFFAAEIYKTYLYCAARIIRAKGGELTAYDGDRVMGVFLGGSKNSNATRAALKINYATRKIIEYSARARVVESFLTTTPSAREESSAATTSVPSAAEPTTRELLMAMSAASGRLRIVTLEGEQSVTAVRTSADGTLELQGSGGWIPLAEVKGFELSRRD